MGPKVRGDKAGLNGSPVRLSSDTAAGRVGLACVVLHCSNPHIMDDEIAALKKEVEHLIAMHTASYVTLTSLVATHPHPQQFQLHLITALEGVLGSERLARWSDDQKQIVRRVVETFQNVRPAPPIDPLKEALGDRDPRMGGCAPRHRRPHGRNSP